MSKRNRRRTRGGSRKHLQQYDNFDLPDLVSGSPDRPSARLLPPTGPLQLRRNDLSARHWQNRFLAWQARERRQKEEQERLKQEQRRIFGGDSQDGEDGDRLCSDMMAFFDGLDYLREDVYPGG